VNGRCGRTHKGEVECSACTRSNVNDTFERIVQFFFFYLTIYKSKITNTKHTYLQTPSKIFTNTSTPPPNLKCHNVHNVTENTKPKGRFNLGMA
jgi:hypothetical protein